MHWRRRTLLHLNRVCSKRPRSASRCAARQAITARLPIRSIATRMCVFRDPARGFSPAAAPRCRSRKGRIVSESVWHNSAGASGGGVSVIFPRPAWQQHSRVPKTASGHRGRGVPDVASHADPMMGYRFYCQGAWHVGAGTSASAPVWAGLIARLNQDRRFPIGLIAPHLYKHFVGLVRKNAMAPVTKGSNGLFRARKGWSCCTGLGSPRGERLGRELKHRLRPGLACGG